jgi:hypothetical protein
MLDFVTVFVHWSDHSHRTMMMRMATRAKLRTTMMMSLTLCNKCIAFAVCHLETVAMLDHAAVVVVGWYCGTDWTTTNVMVTDRPQGTLKQ